MPTHWWKNLDGPILGRYRIERLLGEGGMARVFLATDLRAERPVAFKTPKIEAFPADSVHELLSRFNREFRAQASDPIQGVIPIYESGEFTDAEGIVRPYLAMQYLSGGSLGELLGGTIGQRERTQTLAEVLDWLVPIARTLDRLHARRYLHRDVKPDNILFNSDGDPFLADLGIVGTLDPALNGSMLGSTSMGVLGSPGSPGYQSPESIQADPALRNVSASDQFSLAVTVYEALAGKLPANASTNQQWYGALMHWAPIPLSDPCPQLPPPAVAAVMKALQARAFERFASCSEFARALASAANTEAAPARVPPAAPAPAAATPPAAAPLPPKLPPRLPPPLPPKRISWLLPAAVLVLVVLGALAWARSELRRYADVEPRVSEPAGASGTSLASVASVAAPTPGATVDPAAAATVPGQAPLPAIADEAVTVEAPVEAPVEAKPSAADLRVCRTPAEQLGAEQSITACTRIIELRNVGAADKTSALVFRGRNLALSGSLDEADKDFRLAIRIAPTAELKASAREAQRKARQAAPESPAPPVKAPRKAAMSNEQFEDLARRCGDKEGKFDLAESIASCDRILAEGFRGYTEALTVLNRARHTLRTQPYAAAAADLDRAVALSYPGLTVDAYRLRGNARIKDGQAAAGQADLDKANEILGIKAPGRQ